MSTSSPSKPREARDAAAGWLWCGCALALAAGLAAVAWLAWAPAVEQRHNLATEVHIRVQQLRSDGVSLAAAQPGAAVIDRFAAQLEQADAAFERLAALDHPLVAALDSTTASDWQTAQRRWRALEADARHRSRYAALSRATADQLDESTAVALSLARVALAQPETEPALRVAWAQVPVTLATLAERARAVGVEALSAPLSAASDEVRSVLTRLDTNATRAGLSAVAVAVQQAADRLAALEARAPERPAAGAVDSAASAASRGVRADIGERATDRARLRWLHGLAVGLGVLALLCLGKAAVLARATRGRETPAATARFSKMLRKLTADNKRHNGALRQLNQAGRERVSELRALAADARKAARALAQLGKPRALVAQLGDQRLATQRQATNQMATTRARLANTQKHAQQWAERCDETAALAETLRQLGEHAALLQVNARIRVGDPDAVLSGDFQRLNDSVVKARAHVDALRRRQADAAARTLDALEGTAQAHTAHERSVTQATSQLKAYVRGQQDLNGRHDALDRAQERHADAIDALLARFEADIGAARRTVKAQRPAAPARLTVDAPPSARPVGARAVRREPDLELSD
ncbi:MAG: hypothetical protein AAGA11_08805 [Pseudomonadota bacterium]